MVQSLNAQQNLTPQALRPPSATAMQPTAKIDLQHPKANIQVCTVSDRRKPIPVWKPTFSSDNVTSLPDFKDGEVVYIEFASDALKNCLNDELSSFGFPNPDGSIGGTEVNLRGNSSIQGNLCVFAGLYVNEHVSGMHQGWLTTYFGAAPPQIASSVTHCRRF